MTGIILAGGIGKRMWPIHQNKLLLPILGKTVFEHVLQSILQAKVCDSLLIIASPDNAEGLTKLSQAANLPVKIVIQNQPGGMGNALIEAENHISGKIVVINGDDFLEPKAYKDVVKVAQDSAADVVLPGLVMDHYFPGGYLQVDSDTVTKVVEKPGEGNEPSNLVKLVVDYFKDGQRLIEAIKTAQTSKDDAYEVALDNLIQSGKNISFSKYQGLWKSLKYSWHILDITDYLLSKLSCSIDPSATIAKTAIVEGEVVIEEGVKIFAGTVVKGPCFIGKNTIIGNGALVRNSMIGESCVVGFGTEIARSYIGSNSWFHTNYIGDSVIEGDFGMGSGAVIANLRLDNQVVKVGEQRIDTKRDKLGVIAGKGARMGVNSATMPGVRLGANSLVGPGVVMTRDVKDRTKVLLKQEYEMGVNANVTSYDQFRKNLKK